jgi:hypothetical protein
MSNEKISTGPQTQYFYGDANGQEEALQNASMKFFHWKGKMRRKGFEHKVLSENANFKQINTVYCRCELAITYVVAENKVH